MSFNVPKVMGILNVTPDSFYGLSRIYEREKIETKVLEMISEGVDIIDVGGCSTRPGSQAPDEDEELRRVLSALEVIRNLNVEVPISVDTFRANVARKCVEEYNVDIINDVSGGNLDSEMWATVAELKVPFVLTHMRGTPENMNQHTEYKDITADVISELSLKVFNLRELGVNDIILDPGFGFSKTPEQNLRLLDELNEIKKMGLPLITGISRKSMIWKTLNSTPEESLNGTIALEAIAIDRGTDILRVHDVKETVNLVRLMAAMKNSDK